MKTRFKASGLALALAGALATAPLLAEAPGPEETVLAFNRAVTASDMVALLGFIPEGAVQFQIRPAHAGGELSSSLTTDLETHWRGVGPLLFSATGAYRRTPVVTASTVDGAVATVWTQTTTETVDRSGDTRRNSFSEVYLLLKKDGKWQIAGVADNRATNTAGAGGPPAANSGAPR